MGATQTWASIEDEKEVVEEMRSDDLANAIAGLLVEAGASSDSEDEDGDDGSTEGGSAEPPPYVELSHSTPLDYYASACGLSEASFSQAFSLDFPSDFFFLFVSSLDQNYFENGSQRRARISRTQWCI